MQALKFLALSTLLLLAAGCATAIRGETQKVGVETDPPGAALKVDQQNYTTPATVDLKRKDEHTFTISKDGYRTVTFVIKPTWDGIALGNMVLPGGSVAMATDRATGADMKFYNIQKIKLEPTANANTPPLVLYGHRDQLLTKEEYDKAIAAELKDQREKIFERD